MEHLSIADSAGRYSPINDEAHSTPHAAGPKDYENKCINPKQVSIPTQASADDVSVFARIARQFESVGLRLYPLTGDSVLVCHPKLGMSRSMPDLRTAKSYLREIGGAA